MLTNLGWYDECRLALFHPTRNFLANEFYHFLRLSYQTTCLLGSLLDIISFLICHFKLRDYLEHFGIYSQVKRKSNICFFFIFLNSYVSWNEWEKILISHSLHLQSSGIFQPIIDQRVTWWKCILTIFKWKNVVPKKLDLKSRWRKWDH